MLNVIQQYLKKIVKSQYYSKFINKEVINRLMDRLEYINLEPKLVIIFSFNNDLEKNIKKRYTSSRIINLFSIKDNGSVHEKINRILLDNSVDLVVIDFSINWNQNIYNLLKEIQRVSKNNTIFIYSSINDISINNNILNNKIIDHYKFNNVLIKSEFKNIVSDNSILNLSYTTYYKFFLDVVSSGLFLIGTIKLGKINTPISMCISVNFGYCTVKK